jgi:IS30 family transposase
MSTYKKKRRKGASPLTLRERIDIEQAYRYGASITSIAKQIGRDKGTVSREVRGKPRTGIGKYQADVAHKGACARIEKRGNTRVLDTNDTLRAYVVEKMKLGWSPEQISIRLPIAYADDETMRVSYETIYEYVYAQIHRGGNGRVKVGCEDLRPYLVRRHARRAKKGFRKARKLERNADLPSIESRPSVVDARTRVGDWEDDTMVSRQGEARIKSTNERRSGVALFRKTADGTIAACDTALAAAFEKIPRRYRLTLTRDRGSENRGHKVLSRKLGIDIYFAHAYCSYERGSNENANGLLRRYFPKKTNFDTVSDEGLATAEYLINTRPRKRLGGLTPAEVFYQETGVALFP